MSRLLISLILLLPILVHAEGFDDPGTDRRYRDLIGELRCLVCQNQSLADSHADLAKDMRMEVHKMMSDGQSNQQIVDFLVARYGDFVRYRPPVKPITWLLWFGPFILLAGGAWLLLANIRKKPTQPDESLTTEQRTMAKKLLENNDGDPQP